MDQRGVKILGSITVAMLVVIAVVIASLIIGTILDNSAFDNIQVSGTNTNESLGAVNNVSNSTFGIISTQAGATCTLTTVYNATGGEVLTSNNYTFYSVCKLILNDTSTYIGETLNVTYEFTYDTGLSIVGVNVTDLKNQFGLFVSGLIAFLAIIGTIVGVVWLVFYVKQLFDKKDGLQGISA